MKILSAKLDKRSRELLRGASSALAIQVFGTIAGFLVSVTVARLLGAQGVGVYFLSMSVVIIAATVAQLGFDNTVVRFTASCAAGGEWSNVRYVNRTAALIVGLAALGIALLLAWQAQWVATTLFGKPFMALPILVASAGVVPFALAGIHASSLRGLKRIGTSQWTRTASVSVLALLLLYPATRSFGQVGAVVAYVTAVMLSAVVAWVLWRRAIRNDAGGTPADSPSLGLGDLLSSSWPLFAVALTGLIMQHAATLLLGVWGSAEEVGIFSVASRLAGLLLFPLLAMIAALAPTFAAMYRTGDVDGLHRLARTTSGILTVLTVPIVVVIAMASGWILGLFGTEFTRGALVLDILLAGVVINAVTGPVSNLLMMSGHEGEVRKVGVVSAAVLLLLSAALMPKYGMVGTAIAVMAANSVQNCYMTLRVRAVLGFWPVALIGRTS